MEFDETNDERILFENMIYGKTHDESYYNNLFKKVLTSDRGLPIRTKEGGMTNPVLDNCINDPPPYPADPDYPNRVCVGGYYCKMSNRMWGCRKSIPKRD